MASGSDCILVQQAIGYKFRDEKLLQEALTAAGAEGDGHDGNRNLALLGQAAVRLAITDSGYMRQMPRGRMGEALSLLDSKEHLASVGTNLGIVPHIKLCPRSGDASRYVIALAMRAIIGAVWKDTDSRGPVEGIFQLLRPSVDLYQGSSPIIQPVTDLSDVQGLLPLVTPSTDVMSGLVLDPIDSSGPQYVESTEGNILSVAEYDTAQHHFSSNYVPNILPYNIFDLPSLTWDPTPSTADTTLTIDDRGWQAAPSSSSSAGPTSAGRKRTVDGSNPDAAASAPASNTEMDIRSSKRPRVNTASSGRKTLDDYVAMEDRRCREHGVPGPGETYLNKAILHDARAIGTTSGELFLRMLVGMCSASSVAALRETLMCFRGADVCFQPPAAALSISQRFSAIEVSENWITSLTMLRRCHILKLWEQHRAQLTFQDRWVQMDFSTESTRKPNKPGNPQNHARSAANRATAECVFTEIKEQPGLYNSKGSKIRRLLNLGQRLSMLKDWFGLGILGLICYESDATKTSFLNFSDRMLLSTAIADFERFLPILDKSQGDLLRQFSAAATPIVQSIFEGTVRELQIFRLEPIDPEEILKLPKGSRELLAMLEKSI